MSYRVDTCQRICYLEFGYYCLLTLPEPKFSPEQRETIYFSPSLCSPYNFLVLHI
jgi:hypothetical protein